MAIFAIDNKLLAIWAHNAAEQFSNRYEIVPRHELNNLLNVTVDLVCVQLVGRVLNCSSGLIEHRRWTPPSNRYGTVLKSSLFLKRSTGSWWLLEGIQEPIQARIGGLRMLQVKPGRTSGALPSSRCDPRLWPPCPLIARASPPPTDQRKGVLELALLDYEHLPAGSLHAIGLSSLGARNTSVPPVWKLYQSIAHWYRRVNDQSRCSFPSSASCHRPPARWTQGQSVRF